MPAPTDVVDAQLEAYNARDLERFVRCYGPTATITNAAGDTLAEGHDGIRAMYGPLFDASPQLCAAIVSRIVVQRFVADHERVDGFNLPGSPSTIEALAVYEVVDDAIAKVQLCF